MLNGSPMIDDENKEQPETTNGPIEERNAEKVNEKGNERGGKKGRVKGPCEVLSSEPYVNVEIVKFGRDPNVSYSSGTIFIRINEIIKSTRFFYCFFNFQNRNYSESCMRERLRFESRF